MTTSTGWNTAQYDAWFAKQVEEGTFRVATSNEVAGTVAKRAATMDIGEGKPQALPMKKVRRWMEKRVANKWVTAPMVRQMEANLTTAGDTTQRIAAALVMAPSAGRTAARGLWS